VKKAGIIGAGVGGIATAIRLALKGYQVTVFEAADTFGGKMKQFELEGFRFDTGPSLFTLPHLVDDLFRAAGRQPAAYFQYQRLEVITHYFFADGTRLPAYADPERFAAAVEQQLHVPRQQVLQYLRHSSRLYEATAPTFLHKSLHKPATYLRAGLLKTLRVLPWLGLAATMHQANSRAFADARLVQLFDRFATYNGSDPYQAPATLNLIPHLEHNLGAYYPEGGMHAIAASLVQLARELGVAFHYREPVEQILSQEGKVCGLQTTQNRYDLELVVSNMDIIPTYRRLLPQLQAPEKTLRQPRSSSALIYYWGIRQSFPVLHLHNIFFSGDYRQEFRHIFRSRSIGPDPTVYVNITSKYTPTDAPPGMENWFVLVNVPHNEGQDWQQLVNSTREAVIEKLSGVLHTDLRPLIACERVWDPVGIESETSSFGGALYGSSSNNPMAAFLRHPNFTSQLKNLYFCGGSVHPGGGIPLCLLSAKIVGDLVAAVD
jgi:diapolycopene oxygenase